MNVNEEIVEKWLQICKNQFTISNIKFKVYGERGGSNYSDIDILAVDKEGYYYDYEIKWRSRYTLGRDDTKALDKLFNQMLREERIQKIASIIEEENYQRIFITTKQLIGKSAEKQKWFQREFEERGIEIIFFEDIIKELITKIDVDGVYDSPILQIIRMLKYYNYIKIIK